MSASREVRAIALLAGHGTTLLFGWQYYTDLFPSLEKLVPLPPLFVVLFTSPLLFSTLGVGVSYSALVESRKENPVGFLALEKLSVGLLALMLAAAYVSIFVLLAVGPPNH